MEEILQIDFDFDAFEQATYEAARVFFRKLQMDRSDETFYSFSFLLGQVTENISIVVDTEEALEARARAEFQRDGRYGGLPYQDFKTYMRFLWNEQTCFYPYEDSEFAGQFSTVNDMLYAQSEELTEMEMELVDEGDVDEDDLEDYLNDNYHEPIEERLKSALRRLDEEGLFALTNARERVHIGLLHPVPPDDILPGPFTELNNPDSCRRYEEDAAVYQRVFAALYPH